MKYFKPDLGKSLLKSQAGVTIVELLVVIGMLGVLVALASMGMDSWHKSRLASSSADLLADLQSVRVSAMTERTDANTLGFGLYFDKDASGVFSYQTFEYVDDGDFTYEVGEETGGFQKDLGNGITVTLDNAGDPTGKANAVLYDKRGMIRDKDWSTAITPTFVLRHPKAGVARCVDVSTVRIREGLWDGANCETR